MDPQKLIREFETGWKHFCSRINFGHSWLDAEAVCFMNEMPGKIIQALKTLKCEASESSDQ